MRTANCQQSIAMGGQSIGSEVAAAVTYNSDRESQQVLGRGARLGLGSRRTRYTVGGHTKILCDRLPYTAHMKQTQNTRVVSGGRRGGGVLAGERKGCGSHSGEWRGSGVGSCYTLCYY